jgi:hypothetical protein
MSQRKLRLFSPQWYHGAAQQQMIAVWEFDPANRSKAAVPVISS